MSNTFYSVSTIDLKEAFVKLETEENENEKNRITKFTQIIGQVTDEVKNCLTQIQLSTDILERKLSNVDYLVSKEIKHINTGVNLLDKIMENLYYLSPIVSHLQEMGVEKVWKRMISPYSNFEKEDALQFVYNSEETDEKDESERIRVEEFMQMLVIQTVGEVKNRLMQIQLSADILERKLSNLNGTVSKEDYIESINSGVNLLDETMENFLCCVDPGQSDLLLFL
ncbi:MAG: hypothetical protein ACE5HX_17935 [bacterium]